MLAIGPYRFSERDATRLLDKADVLFGGLPSDLADPGVAAAVEAAASRAVAAAEAARVGGDLAAGVTAFQDGWAAAVAAVRAAGGFGPTITGTVVGCFAGDGGVPKEPRRHVDIGFDGVAGDRQDDRKHHGAPFQAVCLWSAEVIGAFQAAGHPLAPGRAGENLTLDGLPWAQVRPGVRLRAGTALLEVSAPATPCAKNARWFLDGRFDLMHADRGPVSRMYATVLEPGSAAIGDPAVFEPPAAR